MTCYHPNKGFYVGINADTGKNKMKVVSHDVDHLILVNEKWRPSYVSLCPFKVSCKKKICRYDCSEFREIYDKSSMRYDTCVDFAILPCGQCIGCRIQKSREWANRMCMELEYTEGPSWFVTLTYDNEHVPVNELVDKETGEITEVLTLRMKDLTNFNKRLRKKYGEGIRFYACGEYGDRTFRPHYHVIYFNLPLKTEQFSHGFTGSIKETVYSLHRCPELEKIWKNGNVIVGQVNWHTCAYVGRYVTKKLTGKQKDKYEKLGIEPVGARMSLKPGIGRKYFDEKVNDIYGTYIIRLVNDGEHYEFSPPQYFNYLLEKYHPELLEILEEHKENNRKKAINSIDMKLEETSQTYADYLKTCETLFEWRIESLDRKEN